MNNLLRKRRGLLMMSVSLSASLLLYGQREVFFLVSKLNTLLMSRSILLNISHEFLIRAV